MTTIHIACHMLAGEYAGITKFRQDTSVLHFGHDRRWLNRSTKWSAGCFFGC